MAYRIAGIDVPKKKLALVVADVEVEGEYQFERRWYGSNPEHLQLLGEWLIEQQVEEVVAVERLAEVPGLGVDSAHQIIAEAGAKAATFVSAKNLSFWVGTCPGEEETAGVNYSPRSPKGQPPDALHSQSSRQRCRQTKREHLRDRLSSFGPTLRTQ